MTQRPCNPTKKWADLPAFFTEWNMVLCWVNIDLSTDLVKKCLALGKCSRQQDLYQSDFKAKIYTGQAEGEPGTEVRLIKVLLSWTLSKGQRILEQGQSKINVHSKVKFSKITKEWVIADHMTIGDRETNDHDCKKTRSFSLSFAYQHRYQFFKNKPIKP